MLITIALIIAYLLIPVFLIYLTHISDKIRKVGAVVLAYALGLLWGNIGIFPKASENYKRMKVLAEGNPLKEDQLMDAFHNGLITTGDIALNQIGGIQANIMNVAIGVAIPLILFSLDLRKYMSLAREALKSMLLAMISLFTAIFIGFLLWGDSIAEANKVGGMLVGVYTGGTPNLAAIGTALNVNSNTYIMTHTYDVVLGTVCLVFLMTIAQNVFNLFLPHFRDVKRHKAICAIAKETEGVDNYLGMLNKKAAIKLIWAFLLAVAIVGISFGVSTLVGKENQMAVLILTMSTLGLAFSFVPAISKIENTFQLGMYLIIVFSLVIASQADLSGIFKKEYLNIFYFVAMAIFGSMFIHVILSKIFGVDSDTTIITITALTYSPPFVPAVAAAIRNKDVIVSGIAVGLLGYSFGTYAGIGMGELLEIFQKSSIPDFLKSW